MISEDDLALVHALQEAPRAPWALLASVLAQEPRTIARRYARLCARGDLRMVPTTGPRLVDRLQLAHLRLRTASGRADEVARRLAGLPLAASVQVTDGSADVYATLVGTDHQALIRSAHEAVAALPGVDRAEVNTALETVEVGGSRRLESLHPSQIRALRAGLPEPRAGSAAALRQDDLPLFRLLSQDARTDTAELARRLGREPSTVSRRLARLRTDGLLGFVPLLTDSASPAPWRVLLWCAAPPGEVPQLTAKLAQLSKIGLLTVTTGRPNVQLLAHLESPARVTALHAELAALCPGLQILETQVAAYAVKVHGCLRTPDGRWSDEPSDQGGVLQQLVDEPRRSGARRR
ncbi:Lrp/AsnC family transcriptional regulator [Streptomyces cavernicola]|uniref:AsnC family transcriptional regulator n=1 Tax=Streptomyces cavernicola TaxID=3043613 RepID=A0ABT6SGR6_9ACTN|nr:AsnC family transcriptional regulator [Streptomyces sp. B-S-A6]MDI3406852.1 AsnC family transcriptional regulator [Streptomyces sp. B-S-A6]